jgi:hypothetical protein
MRLTDLTKDQAIKTLDNVEKALATKNTKSAIVASLASQGLCSASSTGIEKTLIKVAQTHNYIPPLFAAIMGVKPMVFRASIASPTCDKTHEWIDKTGGQGLPSVPQTQTTKSAGPTPKSGRRLEKQPTFSMSGVNLRSVSIVEILDKKAKVHLRDGSTLESSTISENVLSKNCTLVDLGN